MVGRRSLRELVPPYKIRNKSVRERLGGSADRYSPLLSAWQRTARRAARPDARSAAWRVFGADGAQRLRQDDFAQPDRRPRQTEPRRGLGGERPHFRLYRVKTHAVAHAQHRLHFSVLSPASRADGL